MKLRYVVLVKILVVNPETNQGWVREIQHEWNSGESLRTENVIAKTTALIKQEMAEQGLLWAIYSFKTEFSNLVVENMEVKEQAW